MTASSKRTVTFTRTGDVDVEQPAPTRPPCAPRVASPAEALHGRYQQTRTFTDGRANNSRRTSVRTDCLRTGDRCMSFFYGQSRCHVEPLVFVDGNWTLLTESGFVCPQAPQSQCQEDRAISTAPTVAESDHAAHRARPPGTEPAVRRQRRVRRDLHAHRRLTTTMAQGPDFAGGFPAITPTDRAFGRYREPVEGTPFGRYQLIELLGRGGMGEVWRAHDTEIDRVVALKMLLPHYAQDPEFDKRFRREARAAARLDDPHVVPIYDVGEIDGRLYVTMRLIDGARPANRCSTPARCPPHARCTSSSRSPRHCTAPIRPASCTATSNRSNILLTRQRLRVSHRFRYRPRRRRYGVDVGQHHHRHMGVHGPRALQYRGDRSPAPTSTRWPACCYQCLTGQLPFPGDTLEQVAVGHMSTPPPRASDGNDTVPAAMDDVIATGLAKQPTDRYSSTLELAAAARKRSPGRSAGCRLRRGRPSERRTTGLVRVRRRHPSLADKRRSTDHTRAHRLAATAGDESKATPCSADRRLAVVLLIAGGVFAAVKISGDDEPTAIKSTNTSAAPPSPAGPEPNTGPFTGVYRADFGRATTLDGARITGHGTVGRHVRACARCAPPNGCVATATKMQGR